MKTFPMLIIDGVCIGGCDSFKDLEHSSLPGLTRCLLPHMTEYPDVFSDEKRVSSASSFLRFPDTINNHSSRLASGFAAGIAALCIAYRGLPVTPWVVLFLAVEYCVRFIFGGNFSLLTMIGSVFVARLVPDFRNGAPKQFASFLGLFFSAFAAGLYLSGYRDGGSVVIACLMGAAALEFLRASLIHHSFKAMLVSYCVLCVAGLTPC